MLNPGTAPLPVREIVIGECNWSVVTATVPDALPPAVGVNTTLRVAVPAAFKISGVLIPFALKSAPLTAIVVIWMGAVPVFVKTTVFVELLLAATVPKLTDVGFACNCPAAAVEPVPANETVIV
jgi:hypothetical protein